MVLVTSKTRAGRAAVGAGSPDCGGVEEGMARLSPALGARHRTSGPTRPEDNRTPRRTLLASEASTPVAVAGRRACAWQQLAGWGHVAFLGVLSSRGRLGRFHRGNVQRDDQQRGVRQRIAAQVVGLVVCVVL